MRIVPVSFSPFRPIFARSLFFLLLVTPAVHSGCGVTQFSKPRASHDAPPPVWVTRGSGAFELPGDRVIVGLGSVRGIRNAALARSIAEGRGRVAAGKLAELFAAVLAERSLSLIDSQSAAPPPPEEGKSRLDAAMKAILSAALGEMKTDARWVDPARHGVYVLARVELSDFRRALLETPPTALAPALRDILLAQTEWAHQQIAAKGLAIQEAETKSPAPAAELAPLAVPNASP